MLRLFDLYSKPFQVQRESEVPLVSIDANLYFVCLNDLLTRSSQVQRESKVPLVSIDANLCFVCLNVC